MASFRKPEPGKALAVTLERHAIHAREAELRRLDVLSRYNVLNETLEPDLEYIVQVVQNFFDTSMAVVNFMDDQYFWCKAQRGVPFLKRDRANTFSGATIEHQSIHVVEDAIRDASWRDNRLVLDPPNMRFYAGAPLLCGEHVAIGTVSISDTVRRRFSGRDLLFLRTAARLVLEALEARIDPWRDVTRGPGGGRTDGPPAYFDN